MPKEPSAGIADGTLTNRRILVVDDNKHAADTLAVLLRIARNDVQTRYDGVEAGKAAESFRPEIIILDLGMPGMDGFEVCRQIRAEAWGKRIVLIALTGWGQANDRESTREAGFDAHLVKPVKIDDLKELLNSL